MPRNKKARNLRISNPELGTQQNGNKREGEKRRNAQSGSAGISARPRFSVLRPSESMQECACLAERSDATCHRQAHAVVPC